MGHVLSSYEDEELLLMRNDMFESRRLIRVLERHIQSLVKTIEEKNAEDEAVQEELRIIRTQMKELKLKVELNTNRSQANYRFANEQTNSLRADVQALKEVKETQLPPKSPHRKMSSFLPGNHSTTAATSSA